MTADVVAVAAAAEIVAAAVGSDSVAVKLDAFVVDVLEGEINRELNMTFLKQKYKLQEISTYIGGVFY